MHKRRRKIEIYKLAYSSLQETNIATFRARRSQHAAEISVGVEPDPAIVRKGASCGVCP